MAGGAGRGRQIEAALIEACKRPGRELIEGAHGVPEGIHPSRVDELVPTFHVGGLILVRAGGRGGLMSAVIGAPPSERSASRIARGRHVNTTCA